MSEIVFSRVYKAGEDIFRAGESGRDAYLIESGRVRVALLRDGAEVLIAELGPGEIFGEMSMIDDAPRSATVTAIEDTEVIVVLRSRFVQPLQSNNPMVNMIMRVVLARFREAQYHLVGAAAGPQNDSLDKIRALALERIGHEKAMRQGIAAHEFEMHYQPIIALDGGHIAGFEALMRWHKGGGKQGNGFISPGQFIPLAEETGLIIDLGRLALEHGLSDHARFAAASARAGGSEPFISINVSAGQLRELDEIQRLAKIIAEAGTDPRSVKLEITESLMIDNFAHATEALQHLKDLGVSIAIDDFGTGYSSLSYLHQFPLDTLKIDRAFVTNMDKSENSHRVVHSVVQLAHALNMDIVAEGIEEPSQLAALRGLGCQLGQGYHMSRPLPPEEAIELIARQPSW